MLVAVGARAWRPDRVGEYDEYYPAVSAAMVVLIIGGVTAANAAVIRSNLALLTGIAAGAVVLNGEGYVVGFLISYRRERPTRIASILSVGMRDFAVAAALVIAAGLPTIASLPAVVFGVVEMATSARPREVVQASRVTDAEASSSRSTNPSRNICRVPSGPVTVRTVSSYGGDTPIS